MSKLTQAEFLAKAIAVHGNKYDYSQTVYVHSNKKIIVICPTHGTFSIVPRIHLQRRGCRACAGNKQLTTADFIAKAQKVHGDKYDYSETIYQSSQAKVRIGCPIHGFFEQSAASHTNGHECFECALINRAQNMSKGLGQFITDARKVHGDKYDYSQTVYVNSVTRLSIICPVHGEFTLLPSSHLFVNCGCPGCRAPKTVPKRIARSASKFWLQAREKHGDTYDYSLTVFSGAKSHLDIICPIHGKFSQLPHLHASGHGCQRCAAMKLGAIRSELAGESFIPQAVAIHGDTYDYSKTIYRNDKEDVEIICRIHGSFFQLPGGHKRGAGCPKCGFERTAAARRHSTEQFIELAKAIHSDIYDYSIVSYINAQAKVDIICAVHGSFQQQPASHLQGSGCPACGILRMKESRQLAWSERATGRLAKLYFLRIYSESESFYKIGITLNTIETRYNNGRQLNGYQYETIALYSSQNAAAVFDWEQSILETFAHLAYTPNQSFGGQTECFSSCNEILEIFPVAG